MNVISVGFNRTLKFNFFDWAIRKFLKTDYSHTYLVVNGIVWEANMFGVNAVPHSMMLAKHEVILEVELEISDEQWRDTAMFLKIVEGHPYSYWAIFKIFIGIHKWKDYANRAFICSELVGRALKAQLGIGYEDMDMITPRDIYYRVQKYIEGEK